MKTTFISTSAIAEAIRLTTARTQANLVEAEKEVASGRLADVGLARGLRAGQAISLRQEHVRLTTLNDTNSLTAARLDVSQAALGKIGDEAQAFLSNILAARDAPNGAEILADQARSGLASLVATLNTSFNGAYVFAGINADVQPVEDYFASGSPNSTAVATSFAAAFGITQSDPGVNTLSATDVQTYLDGDFAQLFALPAWQSDWSAASTNNIRNRISINEMVVTSTNANEDGVRALARAFTMLADLGVENMNEAAFQTVADTAAGVVGEAIQSFSNLQAGLGIAQERIERADERISIQINIVSENISDIEAVDPFEATTRMTSLLTQLEASYALTARIQRLSLLNFL